jgi:F0F1-type ATP synthase membrane subunit b/b'
VDIKKSVDKTVADTKDAVNEAKHRAAAQAERTKRDLAGDDMTVTEKAGSALKQAKEQTQAEIDRAKRDVRSGGRR